MIFKDARSSISKKEGVVHSIQRVSRCAKPRKGCIFQERREKKPIEGFTEM